MYALGTHTHASDTDATVAVNNEDVEDDDTAGADVAEQPGKIQGNAAPNG